MSTNLKHPKGKRQETAKMSQTREKGFLGEGIGDLLLEAEARIPNRAPDTVSRIADAARPQSG